VGVVQIPPEQTAPLAQAPHEIPAQLLAPHSCREQSGAHVPPQAQVLNEVPVPLHVCAPEAPFAHAHARVSFGVHTGGIGEPHPHAAVIESHAAANIESDRFILSPSVGWRLSCARRARTSVDARRCASTAALSRVRLARRSSALARARHSTLTIAARRR
jgi:hypothetical protein